MSGWAILLRSALQTRRQHNVPTWALFIDLVKAFDTIKYELPFQIVQHYGVPEKLFPLIKKLYTEMAVNVQLGKEKASIPYTIGVQQGDNMASVLFIFVMLAFTAIIEKNWSTKWGLQPIQIN
jgi:Reverse transcriptase (RNA-dependent DNA polymerase)